MAQLSFRDRFFSPPVAHATTSPTAILALGAGAAVGIVATVGIGLGAAVAAAVVGGALGYGGRIAFALPHKGRGERIRPRTVDEPWRAQVEDAIDARTRFGDAVKSFRPGPMRDTMTTTADRVEDAVEECWRVAQQGHAVSAARARIDDREISWELQRAQHRIGEGAGSDTQAKTLAALENQLQTAARMDALVTNAREQLSLLNARLDETVARAIELSVSDRLDDAASLGEEVGDIVADMESLRMAIEDVDDIDDIEDVDDRPPPPARGNRPPPPVAP